MSSYDHIIVGAGHNGLICACYLARAGEKVLVLERRPIVGGAVCTEEIVPGYQFDVGSSAHIMFRATPIMDELGLAECGLEYVEMDPWAFFPLPDGSGSITFYRDLDKTCESIAQISPDDALAYREFVKRWTLINEGVFEVFQRSPTPGRLFATLFRRNLVDRKSRELWSSMDTVRQLMGSYGRLIRELFVHPHVRTALSWLAAQSGPPPTEMASGDLLGWNAIIHKIGSWRAVGGSGSLTKALRKRLESYGGEVRTSMPVESIGRRNGRFEVVAGGEDFSSEKVVAACHLQTTFLDLLDDDICPAELKKRVSEVNVGNGFGMITRNAVGALPQYAGIELDENGRHECHSAMQLLCPDEDTIERAYRDFQQGKPAEDPLVLAMTFSAIDPTLAPKGKHVLFAWTQYQPYELADGGAEAWDDIEDEVGDRIWSVVERYAPNMKGQVTGRLVQTPLDLERRIGLRRGNVMHLEMSIDQMFCLRPLPELSGYRTPVEGLYLTGASTHPGGGVFGASGRNAAEVILGKIRE